MDRRQFIRSAAVAGGALCLEVLLPRRAVAQAGPAEITAWLVVRPDDSVVVRIARAEMGQGTQTGLAMLAAEELGCDWNRVTTEFVSVAEHLRRGRPWGSMVTGGSLGIRASQRVMREAGAAARQMLVAAAAARWQVAPAECSATGGMVRHDRTARQLRYGELAADAARMPVPAPVALKPPSAWRVVGQSVQRLDLRDKLLGRPVYAGDVALPGLVHASIAQCPVFGGRLARIDNRAAALRRRGVIAVVELGDAVAVVADNWWRADQALGALSIRWDTAAAGAAAGASSSTLRTDLARGLESPAAAVATAWGDARAAIAGGGRSIEADYATPLLAHATLEPQNATALWQGGRLTVWAPTQNGEATAEALVQATGLALEAIEVHRMQLGGGFGRRGARLFQDAACYAARIAQAQAGRPVRLMYSRREDMQHDFYRPPSMVRQRALLDDAGRWVAWSVRVSAPSIEAKLSNTAPKGGLDEDACSSFADSPYLVPLRHVDYVHVPVPVPIGYWRAVYHSQNPFMRECFVDEVASAAGRDPWRFRQQMLSWAAWRGPGLLDAVKRLRRGYLARDALQRQRAVLDAAAEAAGWDRPAPPGHHRGIALADGYGSYTAAVIEVSVSGERLRLHRVVIAVDCGHVVNPDAAKAQIEGGAVFALTAALWGDIAVKDGRVLQSSFADYPLMSLAQCPRIDPVLVPSGGFWGGMGEPPVMPVAPALVNAIAAATGRRIRSLPIVQQGLRLASA